MRIRRRSPLWPALASLTAASPACSATRAPDRVQAPTPPPPATVPAPAPLAEEAFVPQVVYRKLEPGMIQRRMRASFGRFRVCYENGLRNCPNLQGRVAVRFVIAKDGTVSHADSSGSDLPD